MDHEAFFLGRWRGGLSCLLRVLGCRGWFVLSLRVYVTWSRLLEGGPIYREVGNIFIQFQNGRVLSNVVTSMQT